MADDTTYFNVDEQLGKTESTYGRNAKSTAMFNTMFGINHSIPGNAGAPAYTDTGGFTFVTRPLLNLSYNNVSPIPKLAYLSDQDPYSLGCAIKSILSPIPTNYQFPYDNSNVVVSGERFQNIRSVIIDDRMPFIVPLTNLLVSISGWPDTTLDSYTSAEGRAKEQMSWADSRPVINGSFDLTLDFLKVEGDPVGQLFSAWVNCIGYFESGDMAPYDFCDINKEKSYMCAIWRLVTDRSRRWVTQIGMTPFAYPVSPQDGAIFNQNRQNVYVEGNETISIPFKTSVAWYNDPRLIEMFNMVVQMTNRSMWDDVRESVLRKMTPNEILNNASRGYPRIESSGSKYMELQWWLEPENIL